MLGHNKRTTHHDGVLRLLFSIATCLLFSAQLTSCASVRAFPNFDYGKEIIIMHYCINKIFLIMANAIKILITIIIVLFLHQEERPTHSFCNGLLKGALQVMLGSSQNCLGDQSWVWILGQMGLKPLYLWVERQQDASTSLPASI